MNPFGKKEQTKYRPMNQAIENSWMFNWNLPESLWVDILDYLNVVNLFKLEQICWKFKTVIGKMEEEWSAIDITEMNPLVKSIEI